MTGGCIAAMIQETALRQRNHLRVSLLLPSLSLPTLQVLLLILQLQSDGALLMSPAVPFHQMAGRAHPALNQRVILLLTVLTMLAVIVVLPRVA